MNEPNELSPEQDSSKDPNLSSYKGSVSGLRGLLSNKLAEGIATLRSSVVAKIESRFEASEESSVQKVPIQNIYPCPEQPRQNFEPKALEELSQTMRELGQAQAITVRKTAQGYEIISGERRYRAAKLAGLTHLDCLIKDCTPEEAKLLALVENVQREDLLPIEEAHYLRKILEENSELTLDKLARTLGTHKSTLSEKMQLTEIPEDLQKFLHGPGKHFTHRHWRVISRIADAGFLRTMLQKAIQHQLSVAELERSLNAAGIPKAKRRKKSEENQMDASEARALSQEAPRFLESEGGLYRIRAMTLDPSQLSEAARAHLVADLETLLQILKKS
jgi:ParB family chromosome partitioning protein